MTPERDGDLTGSGGKGICSHEEITEAAENERKRLLSADVLKWTAAYDAAAAQKPWLVVGRKRVYYLVEFRKDTATTGIMLVHSRVPKVASVTGIQKPEDKIRFYQQAEMLGLLEGRSELLSTQKDFPPAVQVTIHAADCTVSPQLYWDPCDQSLSPFKPFYLVDYDEGKNTAGVQGRLFVRVDGLVYTQITFGGAGM